MSMSKSRLAADREAWRAWLAKNHQLEKGVWLIYFKKHAGKTSIPYEDSVEEALCYGWIDSLIQRIDDDKYARLFTPRIDKRNWSESNKRKIAKLIHEGRMTAAGLAKASYLTEDNAAAADQADAARKRRMFSMPIYMRQALLSIKKAGENFNSLAPSYQRLYIGWITAAKKEQTRRKRLAEAIGLLEQNRKLGLK